MSENFFDVQTDFKPDDNLFEAGLGEAVEKSEEKNDSQNEKKDVLEYITDSKGNRLLKHFKCFLKDGMVSEGTNTYKGSTKVTTEYKVTYANGKTKTGKSTFNGDGDKIAEEYVYEYENGCIRRDKIKFDKENMTFNEYSVDYPNKNFEKGKVKYENNLPTVQEYTLKWANGDEQSGKVEYDEDGKPETHKYTLKKANGEVVKKTKHM